MLSLVWYPFPTQKGFADFLSNFPLLEDLVLIIPNQRNSLKLSSPSLRKLVLHVSCDLEEIDINTPNLLSFSYSDWPHVFEKNSPALKACMDCYIMADVDTLWFQKLRRFLDKTNTFNNLKLQISMDSTADSALKLIRSPPYQLEHVELDLFSTVNVAKAVEETLWCCRPRSLTLISDFSHDFEEQSRVVKFTYKTLLQQEEQGQIDIQFVLSYSSKAKRNFSDLNSLLKALARNQRKLTITFVKEEVIFIFLLTSKQFFVNEHRYGDCMMHRNPSVRIKDNRVLTVYQGSFCFLVIVQIMLLFS
ncbi:F-box domain, Leucine-rich repeat domain, L domain-like protein [Artemisia annua]|uniref:F-box domain, Leucine-rich repeat domain, L domain-like protein n=1 Tax=Artemisia annua TaxID=35608 RepID=A0A2U1MEK1_ARTAN|nr:F-box domain, Leucine-rich repeat domain, L domain-like protein [Artemisia annua]